MKKRWMNTVIETSKKDRPALPFARGARANRTVQAPIKARKVA